MSEQAPAAAGGGRRRRGRRRGAADGPGAEGVAAVIEQPPFRQPKLPFPPTEMLSADELESIHNASLQVLSEIGVDFLHEEAKELLRRAGAEVEAGSDRVRFDPGLVEETIGRAPAAFDLHSRNPAHRLRFGDGHVTFCAAASAPNAFDLQGGRRPGNRADYRNFLKLGQMLNAVHMFGGYPVEPIDIHPGVRHLEALQDMLVMTDKAIHAYSLGRERIVDAIEMTRIARGIDRETLLREPSVLSIINSSSPLRLDTPMLEGVIQLARHRQPVVLTPFTLAGAMAPVTIAGALVQQNAEVLAGYVLCQAVEPGAPFVYGGFTSNVDMKSGAPAFGTPEAMRAAIIGGQLARLYRLPYRSSNVNAANSLDAQAGYEAVFSLWGAIMGGVNMLKHGLGWMEGGLQTSFEKFVMDADLLQMVAGFLTPVGTSPEDLALDAMREVGPGGHFFGCAHTRARYKTAFYQPLISDWRNYESWEEAGRPQAPEKANRIYRELVAAYEPPPMDPAAREELEAFVARRTEEGGAPTDF
ncbi:MAG: methyltransferase [Rhizobiales bacterium NRL2]|jgi:trimethylamine--corrinoid protein Co-methyltransferase|nr:MAG: methyltransferase [Rhizobiales bacterium NRL2]